MNKACMKWCLTTCHKLSYDSIEEWKCAELLTVGKAGVMDFFQYYLQSYTTKAI